MRVGLAALLGSVLLAALPARADDPPVARVALFTATWCPHCAEVKRDVLPALQARFGARLEVRERDVDDRDAYAALVALEDARGVPAGRRGIPVAILGPRVFVGTREIAEELPPAIEAALAAGGSAWPEPPAPPPEPVARGAPIHLVFFQQTGCSECGRARRDIALVQSRYPELRVEERNVFEDAPLGAWLAERAGRELATPAVFVGERALIGADEVSAAAIEALVRSHARRGAPSVLDAYDEARGAERAVERFRSWGVLAVLAAGLVDGVNPCAFATLIFFVSYLTVSGRRGRQVLAAGASFTLGVFLAYLAVGLGLYRLLDLLGGGLSLAGRVLMGLTAIGCAALAIFSFRDFLAARRGDLEGMKLVLPDALEARVRSTIRRGKRARSYVAVAFVTGLAVSLLELACTGQVYLPTIVFVTTVPELRATAVLYLVLYNVVFVGPLVLVFGLVYFGTTSKQLVEWLRARAKVVKLGMTLFFAVLATWLAWETLR